MVKSREILIVMPLDFARQNRHGQTYVPTAPADSVELTRLSPSRMLKVCAERPSLSTISTIRPPGVSKATLGSEGNSLVAIRTDPGRTNLEA